MGHGVFTDHRRCDDVSIMTLMLEVIVFALEISHEESSQLGQVGTRPRYRSLNRFRCPVNGPVLGHQVEVVESFIYLGSCIEPGGETDIKQSINQAEFLEWPK